MSALSSPTLPILRRRIAPSVSSAVFERVCPWFLSPPFRATVFLPGLLSTVHDNTRFIGCSIECHFVFVLFRFCRSICGFTVWLNPWRFINYLRLFVMGNLISITKYFVCIPLDCFIADILRTKNVISREREEEVCSTGDNFLITIRVPNY